MRIMSKYCQRPHLGVHNGRGLPLLDQFRAPGGCTQVVGASVAIATRSHNLSARSQYLSDNCNLHATVNPSFSYWFIFTSTSYCEYYFTGRYGRKLQQALAIQFFDSAYSHSLCTFLNFHFFVSDKKSKEERK